MKIYLLIGVEIILHAYLFIIHLTTLK